ncbi:MAG: zinc metallopeptidase [Bryobacterales bacterium]|nr:zinc metallopeptidase [Bryobacterales bacterium]
MRWTPGGRSRNLEDLRGESGGGGFRRPMLGGGGLGLGGILILLVLSFVFKQDLLSPFLGGGGVSLDTSPGASAPAPVNDPSEENQVQFVSFVLDDTENVWTKILSAEGSRYPAPKLVLFRDAVQSACGFADAATGPFYCPGDQKVYIDLGFFEELRRRFGAPGDFAQAYVLAHEVGHHIQNLLGVERQVRQLQRQNPSRQNELSVRMELQADCFAGVWAHSTAQRNLLEEGDVEEALRAAAAVGDDHIQQMARGRVSPETFTHGSSAQRVEWFRRGMQSGNPEACNTFAAGASTR